MKIAVYTTGDDVPDHLRCVAQFVVGGKFTPVYVPGRTPEEAREKAQEFWNTYSEDIQRGRVPKGKRGPNADAPVRTAEAEFDPLDDL